MILLSHPTGNANVRHSLEALSEARLLKEFWTCVAWNEGSMTSRLMPSRLKQQFARRTFPAIDANIIKTTSWREIGRLLAPKLHLQLLTAHETGICSLDAVYRALDAKVARRISHLPDLKAVYCYEDGACTTFQRADSLGLARIYDLPIGYWKAGHEIYAQEKEREPQWATTLSGARDSSAKLERKEQELALADHVLVASSYTKQTLEMAAPFTAQVHVVGYGAPPATSHEPGLNEPQSKLKLLFVGSLSQRKGLSYLLEAVEKLGSSVQLTIIGQKPSTPCAPLEDGLRRHRWIESLPHGGVLEEMRQHDVFIFPSLFEGFGLVLLEAMSQGLPVIATAHTAAPDFVEEGQDGFIVPIRSADAIVEKVSLLLNDRKRLQDMKVAAWRKAQTLNWNDFREGIRAVVANVEHLSQR